MTAGRNPVFPGCAWHPPGAQHHFGVADTHLVIRPQRVSTAPQTLPAQLQAPQGINLVGYLAAELGDPLVIPAAEAA